MIYPNVKTYLWRDLQMTEFLSGYCFSLSLVFLCFSIFSGLFFFRATEQEVDQLRAALRKRGSGPEYSDSQVNTANSSSNSQQNSGSNSQLRLNLTAGQNSGFNSQQISNFNSQLNSGLNQSFNSQQNSSSNSQLRLKLTAEFKLKLTAELWSPWLKLTT